MSKLLRLIGLRKSFGGVEVLHGVDFEVRAGEVHALVGENGAGKSTLMKIASGVYQADAGQVLFEEKQGTFHNPREALAAGIAMVHQELSLAPDLTVAQNLMAGREPTAFGLINWKELNRQAAALMAEFDLRIHPATPTSELGMGHRQVVEILKALAQNPRLIIFDEPTSSLEAHETNLVLQTIRRLAERELGVVYISHRLDEVFQVADRITVLRDGNLVATRPTAETSRPEVINLMVGRELTALFPPKAEEIGEELLRVEGLEKAGVFADISFNLHRGEVLGFSGLVGSGRTELMLALFGAEPADRGIIRLEGQPLRLQRVGDAMAAGLAYVTEDRKTVGLFLERSIEDNIGCASLDALSPGGVVSARLSRKLAAETCQSLDVRYASLDQSVGRLSGGNQQKVLFGRWLATRPKVLLVDEPTRGVDVGAKAELHRQLRAWASAGNGVIVVSSELPELIGLCDRILVMHEGRLRGEVSGADATEEKLIALAFGGSSG